MIWAYAALAGLLVGGWGGWEIQAWRMEAAEAKRQKHNTLLIEANRELMRGAELRYDVKITKQVTYLTKAAKEVRHATENLASCPLSPDSVRLFHDAAACYADPTTCGPDHEVPSPGKPSGRADSAGPR